MNEEEIWKDIEGYEGLYQISNFGRVKSFPRLGARLKEHILKVTNNNGYMRLSLAKNKTRKYFYIHVLVAKAFIPNPNKYPEVNHIDENKSNNHVDNLEWCNKSYNANYGNRNKLISLHSAMLRPVLQFDLNGNFIKEYSSIREAVKELKIRSSGISNCCAGRYSKSGGYKWRYKEEK